MKKITTFVMAAIFAVCLGLFSAKAQTVYPYFPDSEVSADISTVAAVVANPSTALLDLTGNFTIEVAGTAGNEIKISNNFIFYSYTPTVSGNVRFVKKSSKVYVYEGSSYKGMITSQSAITYPDIADATATTSSDQLLQNASFETTGGLVSGSTTNYYFGTPWVTNVTVGTSGGIRIGTNANAVNGTYVCIWRGSGNSNYFAQPVTGIKANTSYKVIVRQVASGNANANFNVGLGSTVDGLEFGTTTIRLGTTYDGTRSTTFITSGDAASTGYFTFKNTSTNTSSSGSDPLTQMDYIALVEGTTVIAAGISGTSGNVYYVNSVYSPKVSLNYPAGDYYDMTSFIVNPSFEVSGLNSWTNNSMQTQTNTPGQGWTKDGNVYCEKWVNQSGNLPVVGITQTVTGIPNGKYKLKAVGHAIKQGATDPTATTGAYLFAGTVQTLVNAGTEYEVANVLVTTNSLVIGFKTEGTITANWAAVDNFRLSYHGIDLTALNSLLTEKVAAAQAILDTTVTTKGYNKTEIQTAITEAGTVVQTEEAINAAITKFNTAITNYSSIVAAYAVLKEALDHAATLNGSSYPGKTAFDAAVVTAQGVYNSTSDKTAQDFTDAASALKSALQTYVLSQAIPANITSVLANPGFDVAPVTFTQTDGSPNGSLVAGGSGYNIPGWDEVYAGQYPRVATANYGITFVTLPDVLNSTTPPATDKAGLSAGAALKMSGSWGSTTVLTQNVTLPAGLYVLSFEAINKNADQSVETNKFGFVPNVGDAIYGTKTLFADTWTTETVTFNLAAETAGKISVGFVGKGAGAGSNGKLYLDNVRLDYYGNAAIVSFNANGGSVVAIQYVIKGEKVVAPTTPTKTGNTFGGWYLDAGLTNIWDFNTAITDNITLYAKWDVIKSDVATLSDLKVVGTTVEGFNAATYTYNVVLPAGTTVVPEITATATDANANAVVTAATALPGATTVEVTAENGTTKLTYTVNFTVAPKSTVATLSDLQVSGTTVTGFAANIVTYNVELPVGTTTVPTVTGTATDSKAGVAVTAATALPGATTVEVTAEDGTTKKTYTINFTVAKSTVATLSDLKVSGTTVTGFAANTATYNVELPVGTTTVPTVTGTATDSKAGVAVTAATALPGATTVVVTAEDGTTKKTYTINFTVAKSTVATLSDLKVSGTTVTGFASGTLTYDVVLPAGTTAVPAVTGTATDSKAGVVVTAASALPGSTTIVVTAEDGTNTKTYTINFTVAPTGINTINSLAVNVYPTITNGSFTFEAGGKLLTITVYDIRGKVVSKPVVTSSNYEVYVAQAGIYFIKVESNGKAGMVKVVKTN